MGRRRPARLPRRPGGRFPRMGRHPVLGYRPPQAHRGVPLRRARRALLDDPALDLPVRLGGLPHHVDRGRGADVRTGRRRQDLPVPGAARAVTAPRSRRLRNRSGTLPAGWPFRDAGYAVRPATSGAPAGGEPAARYWGWGGVPLSRPRLRGSARGSEPCAVPCHLCAVLGCTVPGESNPALPVARQEVAGFSPPARGCARLRDDYLLHPARVTPAGRTPSWTAGSARRARVPAGPGHRPATAAAPPAGR